MGRKRKEISPPAPDALQLLNQRLEHLEAELKERDSKIEVLDAVQKKTGIGTQRYGASEWKSWESGSEKGKHRSFYVDIRSLITPRAI